MFILVLTANSYGESIVYWPRSLTASVPLRYLHLNHHCCQLLQFGVWTLLTSLMSKSESATAFQSTISSARKSKNRSSSSESLKRSVLKTGNAFLRLDFQKLSLTFASHKKTMQNGAGDVVEVSYGYIIYEIS